MNIPELDEIVISHRCQLPDKLDILGPANDCFDPPLTPLKSESVLGKSMCTWEIDYLKSELLGKSRTLIC